MIIPAGAETNAEYHGSGAWGSSRINDFVDHGPQIAYLRLSGALPQEESTALTVGSALHARFDGSYEQDFEAGPKVSSRRTKAWQEAVAATKKTLLLPSEVAVIDRMEESIRKNPYAACLLEGAQHEVGIRREHDSKLFSIQCRMDVWIPGQLIADIKTTADVDGFTKSITGYGYYRQAAFYRHLCELETGASLPFSFIVVEKQAPHRCRVVDLDDGYLQIGQEEVQRALGQITTCYRRDDWSDPAYQQVEAPAWLRGRQAVPA